MSRTIILLLLLLLHTTSRRASRCVGSRQLAIRPSILWSLCIEWISLLVATPLSSATAVLRTILAGWTRIASSTDCRASSSVARYTANVSSITLWLPRRTIRSRLGPLLRIVFRWRNITRWRLSIAVVPESSLAISFEIWDVPCDLLVHYLLILPWRGSLCICVRWGSRRHAEFEVMSGEL